MIQAEKKCMACTFSHDEASWLRKMQGCPYTRLCAKKSCHLKDREKLDCRQELEADKTEASSWQLLVPECTTVHCVDLQEPCRYWKAPTMVLPRGWAASAGCSSPPDCFVHPASDSVASKATSFQSILWSKAYCLCLYIIDMYLS